MEEMSLPADPPEGEEPPPSYYEAVGEIRRKRLEAFQAESRAYVGVYSRYRLSQCDQNADPEERLSLFREVMAQ